MGTIFQCVIFNLDMSGMEGKFVIIDAWTNICFSSFFCFYCYFSFYFILLFLDSFIT